MNKKLKKILLYWRIPLYFLIALILLIALDNSPEDEGSAMAAIALFIAFPGFMITLVRAMFLSVKRPIEYSRYGWPEEIVLPEVEAVRHAVESLQDEIETIADFSPGMRVRYFIFRVVGALLIAGGIVIAFLELYVIGTLVIIAGATLWLVANPRAYNEQVNGVRMVACKNGEDIRELYALLRHIPTSLGTPYMTEMRGYKTAVMVYGPDEDDNMVIVYPAPRAEYFYVTNVAAASRITARLTEPVPAVGVENGAELLAANPDYALEEITGKVERALGQAE